MAKILGRARIVVDGRTLLTKRGFTLDPGGVKRTPVVGSRSVHGYTEEIMPPTLEGKVTQTRDYSAADLALISDATVVFEGDDGVTYTLRSAFVTDVPTLSETEGEINVKFSAISCDRS